VNKEIILHMPHTVLTMNYHKILFLLSLAFCCSLSYAKKEIDFNDFRTQMGGEKDARIVFNTLMNEYKDTEELTVSFHRERYDFYPEDSTVTHAQCAGLDISCRKGLTIEGNGAQFIFHGIMGISRITHSKNVTMRNFSVDWVRPVFSQCEVIQTAEDYMDVYIDCKKYPCHLSDGKLIFTGEGWQGPILPLFLNVYDSNGEIQYNTWDATINKEFANAGIEALGEGVFRFHYHPKYKPVPGSIIALIHSHYAGYGISAYRCKNLRYENLTIYHSMGPGITGDFCENVTEKHVRIIANKEKGRVFSTEADAQHYRNCKGLIWFDGCETSGQADDFVNVHGTYYRMRGKVDNRTLNITDPRDTNSKSHDFAPGEKVAFLQPKSGQREYILTVDSVSDQHVTFREELPQEIDSTFYVENYTWTPSFLFENCKVTKGNRARGILFTTPKPVVIRNNYFHSAGTAILIEGDIDVWYESGACTDVEIYGNTFDNCLTSGNRDGDRWQWGDGVITITPSHRPMNEKASAYHRNIRIHNNIFRVFDTSLLRACSVDGLFFRKNKIIKTYDYKPYLYYKDSFTLEGCRNVIIEKNKFDKDYIRRTIKTTLMSSEDVESDL